jgi:hypothetical protein
VPSRPRADTREARSASRQGGVAISTMVAVAARHPPGGGRRARAGGHGTRPYDPVAPAGATTAAN